MMMNHSQKINFMEKNKILHVPERYRNEMCFTSFFSSFLFFLHVYTSTVVLLVVDDKLNYITAFRSEPMNDCLSWEMTSKLLALIQIGADRKFPEIHLTEKLLSNKYILINKIKCEHDESSFT